jgi:integrase
MELNPQSLSTLSLPRTLRRGRPRLSLPLAEWPRADQQAWQRACTPPGSLLDDEGGGAASWRPTSRAAVEGAYGHWLRFLQGRDQLTETEPAARLIPAQVQAYAAALRESRSWSAVANYLSHLGMAAAVLDPGPDWTWLKAIRGVAKRQATPVRHKTGRLTTPLALLQLGQSLMAEAVAAETAAAAALRYRDGLMIAWLALLPLRRRNLMGLELEQQLTRQGGGWVIAIPGEQTKNHRPIEMAVPPVLAAALETYLAVHRPYLLAQRAVSQTQSLWLSNTGQALSGLRAWKMITTHTRQRLGVAVHPHLFRDCAASFLGEADPEHVRLAAPLLGHSSFVTTERHYIAAQSRGALRQHHKALFGRRALRQGKRTCQEGG